MAEWNTIEKAPKIDGEPEFLPYTWFMLDNHLKTLREECSKLLEENIALKRKNEFLEKKQENWVKWGYEPFAPTYMKVICCKHCSGEE